MEDNPNGPITIMGEDAAPSCLQIDNNQNNNINENQNNKINNKLLDKNIQKTM